MNISEPQGDYAIFHDMIAEWAVAEVARHSEVLIQTGITQGVSD
jgi:hypothetical protein